ncbi:MAG: hypothetical protein II867_00715, partial [Clostridia bacterium]|nr:hypothetical protein [Clostridia bacterium]
AVAGVVASSVATVVMVVAVFISTLTINLSLVLADVNRLVIQIEMTGAQDEDFETHIVAILDGADGAHYEQNISPDSLYLTFTNLTPNTEYTVRVKNDEKVFVEKTFITAKESEVKGSISASVVDNVVYITVQDVVLKSDEFYSVYAKNEAGKTLFSADSKEPNANFSFVLSEPQTLHFSIAVGGVVYAVDQIEMTIVPAYDYTNPTWAWESDFSAATVSFGETHGGDPLVVPATVTNTTVAATCEEKQQITYTATATIDGQDFNDSQTISVGEPLGHDYTGVEPTWEWTDTGEVDDEGIPVYTAVAVFACKNDPTHTMRMEGGDYSYEDGMATCEEDGLTILYSRVTYNDVEYEGTKEIVLPATGHAYTNPVFEWTPVYSGDGPVTADDTPVGYTAKATFTCANDSEHTLVLDAEVTYVDTAATCEEDSFRTYTATVSYGGNDYSDEHVQTFEETAIGHDFSQYTGETDGAQPVFNWTETADGGYTATATFYCNNNSEHTEVVDCEIGHEDASDCDNGGVIYYYASVTFEGKDYQAEKQVEVAPGHNYIPVFHWIATGDGYQVEFYMVCEKEDSSIPVEDVEVTTAVEDGYTLYTATATYEGVEYTEQKKYVVTNTNKELAVGVNYFIGDTIELPTTTTFFTDDYGSAPHSNMSGSTYLDSALKAGETGGVTFESDNEDVLNYDRIKFSNEMFVRANAQGSTHSLGYYESSFVFTASEDNLIGVTITSGSGTEADPYVVAPVHGVSVTFDANDGIFGVVTTQTTAITQYYTAQEVSDGVYAIPPTENPEADGRLFLGWFTDEYGENKFDFETTPITE